LNFTVAIVKFVFQLLALVEKLAEHKNPVTGSAKNLLENAFGLKQFNEITGR